MLKGFGASLLLKEAYEEEKAVLLQFSLGSVLEPCVKMTLKKSFQKFKGGK